MVRAWLNQDLSNYICFYKKEAKLIYINSQITNNNFNDKKIPDTKPISGSVYTK